MQIWRVRIQGSLGSGRYTLWVCLLYEILRSDGDVSKAKKKSRAIEVTPPFLTGVQLTEIRVLSTL